MSKILKSMLALICTVSTMAVVNAASYKGDVRSEVINAGTVITVKAVDNLDSTVATEGSRFDVVTVKDIYSKGKLLLPKGTIIRGSVVDVTGKRMLSRDAVVFVKFDHLVSPTGGQIPVSMGLTPGVKATIEGALGYGGTYKTASKQNVQTAGKIIKNMTNWGIETGNKVEPNGWPKYILTPISSVVSVPVAGFYLAGDEVVDLFKKGVDISVEKGECIDLVFLQSVSVPVH